FCLTDDQVIAITNMLIQIETLYDKPTDIEWAFADGTLYMLQARPITAYIPLTPEMMTAPGERRILYLDAGLTEGMTINRPIRPLTLDWMFGSLGMFLSVFLSGTTLKGDGDPKQSLMFGSGGRFYANMSQILAVVSTKRMAKEAQLSDALLGELLANIDEDRYRALKKPASLRWWSLLRYVPRMLGSLSRLGWYTIPAFFRPEAIYQKYQRIIAQTVSDLQEGDYSHLSLREMTQKLDADLTPVIRDTSFPPLILYMINVSRLEKQFARSSADKALVESLSMGYAGNEAVEIGIQLYRLAKMLTPADFADLNVLSQRLANRDLPDEFLSVWDKFVAGFGMRGPGELELANVRYGDDPTLALEQMSYMVDSEFDPGAMQAKHVAERWAAYKALLGKVNGRKRKKLQRVYKILDLFAATRDTPKYLWVLDNGAFRQRALQEGKMFVENGRLDSPEDIFWLTLNEIDSANADSSYDLRQAVVQKQPFYRQLEQVLAFPHIIDSRGRIGQVEKPAGDPSVLVGMGVSRGVAKGRIKVLHTPREKPVEKGDVLVAYTTDPGWTPLFVNAEAIILEVGGMLQHGGVVAREYGKPCVAGIQGITTTLQDGQLVEVDGTTGVVRILEE
ncbi:MAG: hypothetical protein GY943_13540, partial [Chloroflexi bacterium]|nr:hypothetical protein [Chloroflexota bacterium]